MQGYTANVTRPWRLVLLGAPGCWQRNPGWPPHGATGRLSSFNGRCFSPAKCLGDNERSPAMSAAIEYMRRGDLVPDTTVLQLVRERVNCRDCRGGFLLDGFPRTVPQAEALQAVLQDQKLTLDAVLSIELPIDNVIARLAGRRICEACKSVYHLTGRPPGTEGVCDQCAGPLAQREDDRPELVRVRMEAYEKNAAPLTDYYRRLGLLVPVPAQGSPETTLDQTLTALQSRE